MAGKSLMAYLDSLSDNSNVLASLVLAATMLVHQRGKQMVGP